MEFFKFGKTRVGFRHIHPLLAELIVNLPALIEPEALSDVAEKRFYQEPTKDADLENMRSDWKAFVEPSLQEHFRSSRDIVIADLKSLVEKDDAFELAIPIKHIEAWLNVLNQARMALAADLGFDETLLNAHESPDLGTDRGLTAFRINMYGIMQEYLIEQLE